MLWQIVKSVWLSFLGIWWFRSRLLNFKFWQQELAYKSILPSEFNRSPTHSIYLLPKDLLHVNLMKTFKKQEAQIFSKNLRRATGLYLICACRRDVSKDCSTMLPLTRHRILSLVLGCCQMLPWQIFEKIASSSIYELWTNIHLPFKWLWLLGRNFGTKKRLHCFGNERHLIATNSKVSSVPLCHPTLPYMILFL